MFVVLLTFPLMMAIAALSDLLTMKIPNRLVLGLVAGFLVVALAANLPLQTVALHLACGLAVLVVTFGMFAAGWIGGGDAKFAAATAMWLGFGLTLTFLLYAALIGGVLTLVLLSVRRYALPAPLIRHEWIGRLHDRKTGIPYGIALAAAGLLVFPQAQVFAALAG